MRNFLLVSTTALSIFSLCSAALNWSLLTGRLGNAKYNLVRVYDSLSAAQAAEACGGVAEISTALEEQ